MDQGDGDGQGGGDGEPLTEAEQRELMVDHARCMREHGVDMPDPTFGERGGVVMAAGDVDPEAFEAANEACGDILEELRSSFEPPGPEEQERQREQMLAFAQCMREHGVDMPDPQFDENGGVGIMIGGPDGPPIDPETMQAAQEACGGLMGPPGVDDPGDIATPRPSGDLP